MNREQLANELLHGCPDAALIDHERIADAIMSGNSLDDILQLPELQRWPETYAWLSRQSTND